MNVGVFEHEQVLGHFLVVERLRRVKRNLDYRRQRAIMDEERPLGE